MQKFIVTSDGRFRFGDVRLHKHLLMPGEDCIGGGMYEFDYTAGRMLLWGESYDFGRVQWSLINKLTLPGSLRGLRIEYEGLPLTDFVEIAFAD